MSRTWHPRPTRPTDPERPTILQEEKLKKIQNKYLCDFFSSFFLEQKLRAKNWKKIFFVRFFGGRMLGWVLWLSEVAYCLVDLGFEMDFGIFSLFFSVFLLLVSFPHPPRMIARDWFVADEDF